MKRLEDKLRESEGVAWMVAIGGILLCVLIALL